MLVLHFHITSETQVVYYMSQIYYYQRSCYVLNPSCMFSTFSPRYCPFSEMLDLQCKRTAGFCKHWIYNVLEQLDHRLLLAPLPAQKSILSFLIWESVYHIPVVCTAICTHSDMSDHNCSAEDCLHVARGPPHELQLQDFHYICDEKKNKNLKKMNKLVDKINMFAIIHHIERQISHVV